MPAETSFFISLSKKLYEVFQDVGVLLRWATNEYRIASLGISLGPLIVSTGTATSSRLCWNADRLVLREQKEGVWHLKFTGSGLDEQLSHVGLADRDPQLPVNSWNELERLGRINTLFLFLPNNHSVLKLENSNSYIHNKYYTIEITQVTDNTSRQRVMKVQVYKQNDAASSTIGTAASSSVGAASRETGPPDYSTLFETGTHGSTDTLPLYPGEWASTSINGTQGDSGTQS